MRHIFASRYVIPLGLVLVALMIWVFFWAVKAGQFDDLESPAVQVLLDDDSRPFTKGDAGRHA